MQCASTDTNVLRAVKVCFKGWGPAMDIWLPVDGGMLAKPGTHLPKKGSPTVGLTGLAGTKREKKSVAGGLEVSIRRGGIGL